MALSKEAQKIKTEYNKKYMERYWERKAEKRKNETKAAAEKTKTVTTKRTTKTVSTVTVKETELFEWLFPEPHVTEVTVSRNGQSDAQYIKALETANNYTQKNRKAVVGAKKRVVGGDSQRHKLRLDAIKQQEQRTRPSGLRG